MDIAEMQDFKSSQSELENLLPSSPPARPPPGKKPRKPPPITPNRFNRFFNLQPTYGRAAPQISNAYRALRDITSQAPNRGVKSTEATTIEFDDVPDYRPTKRRRVEFSETDDNLLSESIYLDSSPPQSSPSTRVAARLGSPIAQPIFFPSRIRRTNTSAHQRIYVDSRCETAAFYSNKEDFHQFSHPSLPFCVASCNRNSLVAIGDENGGVRILESGRDGKPGFDTPYVTFQPHDNAVMDMAFSSDDYLLASAAGDQSAKIIDMHTQTVLSTLTEHSSSLKQVSFQPGNDKVLATTSRDGIVALWDIRSKTPKVFNTIVNGHTIDVMSKSNSRASRGETSITALTFLPGSNSHLFVTASDATAQLRLWDIRGRYNRRSRQPVPLSTTSVIPSHTLYRHFGVSALALSTDAARLYSVCRDGTVYVYATSHLALGQSYSSSTASTRVSMQSAREGLEPLYGLRHPNFRTSTFYIKASVRKAFGDSTELLAVGSSDGCAVIFSTDEETLRRESKATSQLASASNAEAQIPRLERTKSSVARERSNQVIFNTGTPLIRGHSREVSGVAWTCNGDLITIGDDMLSRVWRQDASRARDLRTGGEIDGRRWGCGWADASIDWDEDDG